MICNNVTQLAIYANTHTHVICKHTYKRMHIYTAGTEIEERNFVFSNNFPSFFQKCSSYYERWWKNIAISWYLFQIHFLIKKMNFSVI